MFNEREPAVASFRGAGCASRYPRVQAHFVEHDEDSSADRPSIDPLDDSDSRGHHLGPPVISART